MHYDLGFFDHETGRVECAENPFQAKCYPCPRNNLAPMRSERTPLIYGVPDGIRTRVTAVKGRCPGPLDDGDAADGQGWSGPRHPTLKRARKITRPGAAGQSAGYPRPLRLRSLPGGRHAPRRTWKAAAPEDR